MQQKNADSYFDKRIHLKNPSREIDSLVNSYNKMIDDLEKSAEKLAKTEREQAWQEMARQVAHEIKNPLTPMRLSIQNFQRRYDPLDKTNKNKVEEFSINWGTHMVQLTESPVNAIVSVETRSSVGASYTTLASADYYLDSGTDSVLYVSGSGYKNWPKGAGSVKVTYTAGYSALPTDLKLAVIDLITYYFKREHRERKTLGGASIQNSATTSVAGNVGFPDHIKRVLDLYKNF